ncbi:MAG TPA: Flp pilus assembly protein CpaB [Gammaproteobacteria bacterium]|nr:Flp pilus assembly protein CpaB [Gammaproteobacteria bacterium]
MHVNRTKILLLAAMVLAIGASWLAYSWVQKRTTGPELASEKTSTQTVVVANIEIPHGSKIEKTQLKTVKWPIDLLPKDAFTKIDEVVGKIANRAIYPEDIITKKRVADSVEGSLLAALISPNKRAVTVRVDDVIGVGGFLQPGNHVDVIGVRRLVGSTQVKARTVLRDVIVLAVDQDISGEGDKPKVVRAVTLEMFPGSAVKVIKAANEGKIHLLLRNPVEKRIAKARTIKRKPVVKPLNVNVIRGTTQTKVKPPSS